MDELLDLSLRAKNGDRSAFGLLYDRYVQEVYRFLLGKTKRSEEAQDLTSITFTKALDRMTTFSPQHDTSFRAWLFTIAHRSFLDGTRLRNRTDAPLDAIDEPQSSESPAKDAEHALLRTEIEKALGQLSDMQRETIVLRVWHECSFAEIAQILGKSEASVKMHMKRGLIALKKVLPAHFFTLLLLYATH